jgi:multiple sugar transport system substrate-binding protein
MSRRTVSEAIEQESTASVAPLSRRQILKGALALGAGGAAVGLTASRAAASGRRAPAVLRSSFQGKATVEIWDQQQSDKNIQDAYTAALTAFQQANPDVEVKITTFPYAQYRDKLLVAVNGGTGPDVMSLDEIWTPEFAAAQVIDPLDDRVAASTAIKPELFFTGAWDTNKYQDKIWGIPLNFDVWEQMYYNADLFKAAGLDPDNPPKTWDDWLAAVKTLTKAPDQFGIGMIGHKGEDTTVVINSLMYSNGGAVIDDSGKAVIDSPKNLAALTFYTQLAQQAPEGVANADEAGCAAAFTAGQVAIILDGSWQQDSFNQSAKFDWRIAVPPAPAGKSFIGALGGWNYAINKGSKSKDAAFKVIEFLSTEKEVQKTINSLTPALKAAGEEFVKEKRKQPDVILTTLNTGRPRPISPIYPQVSDVEQSMVQSFWSGTAVADALKDAHKQIEDLIAQNA